jgi:hypothetical protein
MPKIRVPLTVEIESSLNLSPSAVNLGKVKVGEVAERTQVVQLIHVSHDDEVIQAPKARAAQPTAFGT